MIRIMLYQIPLACIRQQCNFLLYHQVRHKGMVKLNPGQINLLMEVTGFSRRKMTDITHKHMNLRTLDQDHIRKVASLLKKLGIDGEDVGMYPQLLAEMPITLENHFMVLQESGFVTVTSKHLASFAVLTRKKVSLLKAHGFIAPDWDVAEKIFSLMKDPPPALPSVFTDKSLFVDVRVAALKHFLFWKLEFSERELNSKMNTYPRMKHKSLRLVEEQLNILEKKLGFSKEKIRRHSYLIHAYPYNTMDTLTRIKTLGGMEIESLLHKLPKIIMVPTDNLLKTEYELKNFGIADEKIQKFPALFTLGCDTVKKRLQELQEVPEFMGLVKHPSVLRIVHYQRKAQFRLKYMQSMNLKCVTLHLLQAPTEAFERHLRVGSDRTNGSDVVIFLSNEMGHPTSSLRKGLHRHPCWCHIPLVTVRETYEYLHRQGFTNDDIFCNIQILLYTKKQIQRELRHLPARSELDRKKWTVTEDESLGTQNGIESLRLFTPKQQLALCLYFIERECHFSGDGIFLDGPEEAIASEGIA